MNPRPTGPKPVALPNCATPRYKILWQGQKDSNPRHVVLETTALPTELYPYTTGERFTNRFTRYGGEDGIRTHAALANPNDLANRPLQPLEYFSRLNVIVFGVLPNDNLRSAFWRRGWDSNPRPLTESLVFKTSSLNHSDTSPHAILTVLSCRCPEPFNW